MTRETLKGFGLTDEQVEKVWAGLDGNFVTKARFNEVNAEKNQLKEQLKTRDGQLETLKSAAGDVDALKKQITELQTANQQKDKEHAAEMKRLKRGALDDRLLLEAKAINPIAAKPFLTAIDDGVDDEGYIALRKQHIEALTKAEGTKFLFHAANGQKLTGFKPGESGDGGSAPATVNPFEAKTYNVEAAVKQIHEGDTSITYAVPDKSITLDGLIDTLMNSAQLVTYRRMRW